MEQTLGANVNGQAWVRRDHAVISKSVTRAYPLVVASAKGCSLFDVDGHRYLDFTSGIAVTATGHCHPKITEAIVAQAKRLIHMSGTDFYYPSEIQLAEVLTGLAPGLWRKKVFLPIPGRSLLKQP
jgi:4-aminobutyrate aminotransferase